MDYALLWLALYFLPAMFAIGRKHRNSSAICAVNLLLGWTVVGWIVAAVWSSTNNTEAQHRHDLEEMRRLLKEGGR
jgi:Superinfection immunity protein